MWLVSLLLIVIAVLLWLLYSTVDSFNEDLKQLRMLVGHIERFIMENGDADVLNRKKVSLAHETDTDTEPFAQQQAQAQKLQAQAQLQSQLQPQRQASEEQPVTVNLNTATKTALTGLPKVGAATAQKIIDARPFTSVEDLQVKVGLSDEVYSGIRERVTI